MDLVRHDLKIEAVACVGIDILRRMAHDAQRDASPRAAMSRKLIVTAVAARVPDHVARCDDRASRSVRS